MTSMASALAPHVPYLRRFSRALTGSQESGDAYVVATLEALVEDPSILPKATSHKVGLFHVYLKIWNSLDVNFGASREAAAGDIAAADDKLERITPRPRQAFLLLALEAFSIAEAAAALGESEATVRALNHAAGHEIADQVATDVLIIEDEPLIAMDLEDLVQGLDHRVIGVARTKAEAIDLVAKRTPGLILADIQLADGSSGLDAVNDLLQSFAVPVIFITAFPERLLTGERPEPAFLIPKPFQPATVRAIISQALFFDRKAGRVPSA